MRGDTVMKCRSAKRLMVLLIVMSVSILMSACSVNIDINNETSEPASTEETDRSSTGSSEDPSKKDEDQSLIQLRISLDGKNALFAVAYLGYLDRSSASKDIISWLEDENADILADHPFIGKIDEEHIIGEYGYLYCIVPYDERSSVVVNRVSAVYSDDGVHYENKEVAYSAGSGDAILLFANLDGDSHTADTTVNVTDDSGDSCEWYPTLGWEGTVIPCVSEEGVVRSWDFTEYEYDQ